MKTVLIVSFRFPPHGAVGALRVAHFTKNLPPLGWMPRVLTGPLETRRSMLDFDLLDLIPEEVEVTRTGYTDGKHLIHLMGKLHLGRLTRMVTPSFPGMSGGWIPHGIWNGTRILREEHIDLIFSSAYPMSSHIVAYALKKRFKIPWVADYRDEWSQRPVMEWPTPIHRVAARKIDRMVTSNADRVITTSPVHTRNFASRFPATDPEKYQTVMNGFDEELFGPGGPDIRDERPGGFLVCHVGSLFNWRGPEPFLEALENLVQEGCIPRDEISVRFIGSTPATEFGYDLVDERVRATGYIPHKQAISWMKTADVLLLINTETTNILAKTFEYLASGRPILALSCPGPTADLIRENEAGIVVHPDDTVGIERALRTLFQEWRSGRLPSLPTESIHQRYSRRASAENLACHFDSLAPRTTALDD